jgi:hypothetical protein
MNLGQLARERVEKEQAREHLQAAIRLLEAVQARSEDDPRVSEELNRARKEMAEL